MIEGISNYSRRNNPLQIIAIVKSTQRCNDSLSLSLKSIIRRDMKADGSFLKEMHRQLLEGDDNIEIEMDQVYHYHVVATLTPTWEHIGAFPATQVTPKRVGTRRNFVLPRRHLDEEVDWFYEQVEAILLSDTDPLPCLCLDTTTFHTPNRTGGCYQYTSPQGKPCLRSVHPVEYKQTYFSALTTNGE